MLKKLIRWMEEPTHTGAAMAGLFLSKIDADEERIGHDVGGNFKAVTEDMATFTLAIAEALDFGWFRMAAMYGRFGRTLEKAGVPRGVARETMMLLRRRVDAARRMNSARRSEKQQ